MAEDNDWRQQLAEARRIADDESQPLELRLKLRHHLDVLDAELEWWRTVSEMAR